MDDFSHLFTLLIGGYGIYFIYQWFKVKVRKQEVDISNFLLANMTKDTCTDVPAMTKFILPWLLIMGISLVAYAAISLFSRGNLWFMLFMLAYFICLIIAYSIMIRESKKRFWPELVKKKEK